MHEQRGSQNTQSKMKASMCDMKNFWKPKRYAQNTKNPSYDWQYFKRYLRLRSPGEQSYELTLKLQGVRSQELGAMSQIMQATQRGQCPSWFTPSKEYTATNQYIAIETRQDTALYGSSRKQGNAPEQGKKKVQDLLNHSESPFQLAYTFKIQSSSCKFEFQVRSWSSKLESGRPEPPRKNGRVSLTPRKF